MVYHLDDPVRGWHSTGPPTLIPGSVKIDPYGGLSGTDVSSFGSAMAAGGALVNAIGSYGAILASKDSLKSQAMSAEFQQTVAGINASQAERDAIDVMESAKEDVGTLGLRAAQEKASERAGSAARGVSVGVGSAAEVQASIELAYRLDALTIKKNAVRQANAIRRGAVNERVRGSMAGLSASNMRLTANSLSPALGGLGSALEGAGLAARLYADDRYRYGRR